MITITAPINPINNGIEFPIGFILPNPCVGIHSDETNYYIFETIEERDAFYAERGLTIEPGI